MESGQTRTASNRFLITSTSVTDSRMHLNPAVGSTKHCFRFCRSNKFESCKQMWTNRLIRLPMRHILHSTHFKGNSNPTIKLHHSPVRWPRWDESHKIYLQDRSCIWSKWWPVDKTRDSSKQICLWLELSLNSPENMYHRWCFKLSEQPHWYSSLSFQFPGSHDGEHHHRLQDQNLFMK